MEDTFLFKQDGSMLVTGIPDGCWDFDIDDIDDTLLLTLYPTPCSVPPEGIRSSGERQSATHWDPFLGTGSSFDSQVRIGYEHLLSEGIRYPVVYNSHQIRIRVRLLNEGYALPVRYLQLRG